MLDFAQELENFMTKEIRSAAEIKKLNIASIKRFILEAGSVTKPEVADATGLSVVTCGSILNELAANGTLVEENLRISSGGRPAMNYRFSANAGNSLCLYTYTESDGTFIRYQVRDISGNIKGAGIFQEDSINIEVLSNCIKNICQPEQNIKIVVLGIQGNLRHGIVEFSDLTALCGHNVAKEIEEATGIPIKVENDMSMVALGYTKICTAENDKDIHNVSMLFFPKGQAPAGSFIVDGHILRGTANQAGVLSCIPYDKDNDDFSKVFSNIELAKTVIDKLLAATIAYLDPSVIVITGGLSKDIHYDIIMKNLRRNIRHRQLPKIEIRPMVEKEYFAGLYNTALDYLIGE